MTNLRRRNHDKYMMIALLPLIFCGTVLYGPRVLLLNAVALVTARIVDVMVSMVRKQDFDGHDNSSILSAIIFCLMLPVSVPVYVVAVTVVITILVGKHLFGGKDVYPFNLAALAMCCAAVNWPDAVFSAVKPFTKVDFFSGRTAFATASNASLLKDGAVPAYDTFQLLLGNYPASMGADFVILITVLGLYLMFKKRITWHVPVTFLATCGVIAFVFPRIYGFSHFDSFLLEMLNGQVFFIALFMLSEPTTTPHTPKAKIIFGILCGVMGMLFRYYGSFEIGTCFALLIVNTMDGYIERMVSRKDRVKVEKDESVPQPETAEPPQPQEAAASTRRAGTMKLISEAEDNLDDVIYSTRTIDINEILKLEEQQKQQRKAGKKNEK
ncbi:MAG: hypothetical protein E7484_00195 [Ruminococcaceae bacterium]|nr:hypothetical protein [Oscillospiraceae bacterium]